MARLWLALSLFFINPALAGANELEEVFANLYNFNFAASHAVLDRYIRLHESDPLPFAVRSAVYLFFELDRLGILEGEFFIDDKKITGKRTLKPDAGIRKLFFLAVNDAESRAGSILATDANDEGALFAMVIAQGLVLDYTALIDKRQLGSLSSAKRSNSYAQRLLKLDPRFYDAYAAIGLTEYLAGSLPFFMRWFVRFEDVKGSKELAIQNLRLAAQSGHYLKPFAKILLSIAYIREKKPRETQKLLAELAHDFPENPLFRKELAKVSVQLGGEQP